MTLFQILMLGASAFFAYKIYEHIQTLKDSEKEVDDGVSSPRTAEAFSTFDASSLIEKADKELSENNLDKALAIFSEANIKSPHNDETLFKMGYTLSLQERYDEALEYFKEAIAIDRNNPFTHLEMAKIYIEDGEIASARMHLNEALEIEPDLSEAKNLLENLDKEL